jgi:hypothetical protein
MQRDGFSLLVVVTALLSIGLVGAALAVPGGAESPAADRTITVDAVQRDYRPVRYEDAAGGVVDDAGTVVAAGEVSVAYRVWVTYDATVASA